MHLHPRNKYEAQASGQGRGRGKGILGCHSNVSLGLWYFTKNICLCLELTL